MFISLMALLAAFFLAARWLESVRGRGGVRQRSLLQTPGGGIAPIYFPHHSVALSSASALHLTTSQFCHLFLNCIYLFLFLHLQAETSERLWPPAVMLKAQSGYQLLENVFWSCCCFWASPRPSSSDCVYSKDEGSPVQNSWIYEADAMLCSTVLNFSLLRGVWRSQGDEFNHMETHQGCHSGAYREKRGSGVHLIKSLIKPLWS